MKPWMTILPKWLRHLIICRWKYGYHTYCAGHGPRLRRYGVNMIPLGSEGVEPMPPPWRIVKRTHHRRACTWAQCA